jgi:hypothetical protein
VVACSAIASLLASVAWAAEYHVATTGDDAASGAAAAPFRTIQHGIDTARAGDTLIVHAGQYPFANVIKVRGKRGTQAAPIVIRAEGEVVLTDGAGIASGWQGMIDVHDSSYMVFRGFTLKKPSFFGIYLQNVDNVTVEGFSTDESGASGLASWTSSNVTFRNNDVRACCNKGQLGSGNACQECISLDHVNGFLIEGNKVHDAQQSGLAQWGGGEGIDVKNGSSNGIVRYNEVYNIVQLGIYVDAWEADIHNVEIYGNHVHHNANGIVVTSEQTGNVYNVRIHDNLVHDNGFDGISISHYDVAPVVIDQVDVFNNTVVRNGYTENKPYFLPDNQKGNWGTGITVGKPDVSRVRIVDNIVYQNATRAISLTEGLSGHTVANNLEADPLFVALASRDLRLTAASPAIDQGIGATNLGTADFYGNARVFGSAVDIGAHEFGSAPVATGGSGGSAGSGGAAAAGGTSASGGTAPASGGAASAAGGTGPGSGGAGAADGDGEASFEEYGGTSGCACRATSRGHLVTAWLLGLVFVLGLGRARR